MRTGPSCAGKAQRFSPTYQCLSGHDAHHLMRVHVHSGSSHGGAAASNSDGWGFDSFRACFDAPVNQSGRQPLDNCRGIVVGPVAEPVPTV